MIHYETDRLILRNYKPEDVKDYFEYMSLASTALHEDFEPYSMGDCTQAVNERLLDDSFWVVVLKENNKVIGDLCFRKNDYETYEIAYDFNACYGRRGYATEACKVLVTHIFSVLNGRRLYVGCNEDNESSWHLLERLGFRREAYCIEDVAFKKDTHGNPIYVNIYFYALLSKEWNAII